MIARVPHWEIAKGLLFHYDETRPVFFMLAKLWGFDVFRLGTRVHHNWIRRAQSRKNATSMAQNLAGSRYSMNDQLEQNKVSRPLALRVPRYSGP